MAKYTGTIPIAVDKDSRVTQIKTLFADYLSDIFTFVSDTGTGTSRYVYYTMPYNTRKVGISFGTNFTWNVRNLADTTNLTNISAANMTYGNTLTYLIVKNANSGCFIIYLSGVVVTMAVWGSADEGGFCTVPGPNLSSIYMLAAGDTTLLSLPTINTPITKPCANGKEVFLPVFVMDDTNAAIYNAPVPDIFTFANLQTVALGVIFTVGTTEYVAIHGTMCMRIN